MINFETRPLTKFITSEFVYFFRLTEAASSGLQELQSRTRAGLEFAASRQTVSVDLFNVF